MVDVVLPVPSSRPSRWHPDWSTRGTVLMRRRGLLLFTLLFALGWTAAQAMEQYREKRCDSPIGKLAVRFKLDMYYSNCQCMKHALDFSDPCNSMYLPIR